MKLTVEDISKIVDQAQREFDAGVDFKHGRVAAWQENDRAYNGDVKKYLKYRFNFALPILSSFEDTLVAKTDEPPVLKFGSDQQGEARISKRYQALWDGQSNKPDLDYASADITAKRHAARYGRGIFKVFGESKPKFRVAVEAIDPYDFICDPIGGGNLENHRFVAQDSIFKTKEQLLAGVKDGLYDKAAVEAVTKGLEDGNRSVDTQDKNRSASSRWSSLKLDDASYNIAEQPLYRLVEQGTVYNGDRVYVLWSPEVRKAVRCEKLVDVFASDLWWFASWAPYHDNKVFWSKAPDDDMRPVGECVRLMVMEAMHNVQKRNWGHRAYDPAVFSVPQLLEFMPDGLVPSVSGASRVGSGLQGGVYEFQTPEVTGTFNVIKFLDQFAGQKTGITPDAQGSSVEDKVGIYFGNLEQVADRMGLLSRHYRRCHESIGRRFLWAAKEHLRGAESVRVMGAKGAEWDKLLARDIDPDVSITVVGGSAEAKVSEIKRKERSAAITELVKNPELSAEVSKRWVVEEMLRNAGYEEGELKLATEKDLVLGSDQMNRAAECVEDLLEGKRPGIYWGATPIFIKTLIERAKLYTAGSGPEYDRIMAFVEAHLPIASNNSAMEAAYATAVPSALGNPQEMSQPQTAPPIPSPINPLTQ